MDWEAALLGSQVLFFVWTSWNTWRLRNSEKSLFGPGFNATMSGLFVVIAAVEAVFFVVELAR